MRMLHFVDTAGSDEILVNSEQIRAIQVTSAELTRISNLKSPNDVLAVVKMKDNLRCSDQGLVLALDNIKEVVGYEGVLSFDSSKPDGNPRKLLDSKLINSYGWKPEISLQKGIENTYSWYKENI